jgi:hypothetical protein
MWWYRLAAGVAGATIALLALAGPALAGGWAVATIDTLPEGGLQAGQTYRLGYTIRQHGQTPFDGAKTAITAVAPSTRERHVFPGAPDGRPGHYVAEVTFPSEGEWSWEVSQQPFAMQTLGTITIAPAAVAGPAGDLMASPATAMSPFALSGTALPLAVALAGLIAWPLIGVIRRSRRSGSGLPLARAR